MGRHGQLMSLVVINWMVKKNKEIYYRSVKRRVAGKLRVPGKNRVMMNSLYRLRNFATCEFSQVAKIFTT